MLAAPAAERRFSNELQLFFEHLYPKHKMDLGFHAISSKDTPGKGKTSRFFLQTIPILA
jgi:hypothetical protein